MQLTTLPGLGENRKHIGRDVDIIYIYIYDIWVFPKIGVPQSGWFIVENPIKMDDLGVPLFLETYIYIYILENEFLKDFADPSRKDSSSLPFPSKKS